MAKKKKEKVIYYDDNSTIADMSNVGRKKQNFAPQQTNQNSGMRDVKPFSTAADKWRTYWSAVKMMVMPMCFVLCVIAILYILIMLTTGGFN